MLGTTILGNPHMNPATRSEPFHMGLSKQNISQTLPNQRLQPTLIVWLGSNWLNENTKKKRCTSITPPKFNSLPPKNHGSKTILSFWGRPSFRGRTVKLQEYIHPFHGSIVNVYLETFFFGVYFW